MIKQKNQWTQRRQVIWNYWVRGTKRRKKKEKWRKFKRIYATASSWSIYALWEFQKEDRERSRELIWRTNGQNPRKEMDILIQEAPRTLTRINLKKPAPRHIQADLRDITGSVPDHHNKVNIAIKWVTQGFFCLFPDAFMFTLCCSLLSVR